jgi:hypothetical protein
MTRTLRRALVLALAQSAIVGLVGVGAAIDRERLPRAVVEVSPATDLPMEGRYAMVHLLVDAPKDWKAPEPAGDQRFTPPGHVSLAVNNGRVVAVAGRTFAARVVEPATAGTSAKLRLSQPMQVYLGATPVYPFRDKGTRWLEVSLPTDQLPRAIDWAR